MKKDTGKDFFITSDTWFGRPQILQIANRPFDSVESMNETLIKNWNKKIKKHYNVFHLGNFAWDAVTARKVLKRLNGKIHFMKGNADASLAEVISEFPNANFMDSEIVTMQEFDSVFCHYPLAVWEGKNVGVVHMHGHTVFSNKTDLTVERRFNVCTDFWNYSPVNYLTLKDFLND
tara:strand:+ start:145 stop:672 length:528 start_codon:yes stop_codon:yes gene_type:complete